MILIADAGSTKIHWVILESDRRETHFSTPGLNPVLLEPEQIRERFEAELLPNLTAHRLSEIHYYGAGCTPQIAPIVAGILSRLLDCTNIEVASDMLGAARALCRHSRGIACILGTGSNSCLFDGSRIVDAVGALGYILGDEGSGAVIGRRFLSDALKRMLPADLTDEFFAETGLTAAQAIEHVYRQPAPNRFLASLMPFVRAHIDHPEVESLVVDELTSFLRRNVAHYSDADSLPVNFTGSIAVHFRPQLEKALNDCNLRLGRILPDPIDGLIDYHRSGS